MAAGFAASIQYILHKMDEGYVEEKKSDMKGQVS